MFHHVKELQFDVRVSEPDPRFASLLLEQFGGGNGELKAAMQYFVQAFSARQPHPEKYDLLMDIATEEFSHLEIVGATIQLLLNGVNGKLKDASENSEIMETLKGKSTKENYINDAMMHPDFFVRTGGGPTLTNCQGIPWSGSFVNANGDLTVDLRSDIAAEARAKIVYEYLLQFTDDPHVKASLKFLMTREVAHMQMFEAALDSIQPNFPPGILQGESRFTNLYFNMSDGQDVRGPWNQGTDPAIGEEWKYIKDPVKHVKQTKGLKEEKLVNSENRQATEMQEQKLGKQRSEEIKASSSNQWCDYD